jgi:DNA-binding response OmpR family regulator
MRGSAVALGSRVNKRILIVDNEESILLAVKRYFVRLGFLVDCARELEEAEALATYIDYDLAIVDLSLREHGGTEGLEVLRFVRRNRPHTRTIVLTAHGTPTVEREAFRRGCDAFLHKPKSLPELAKIAQELTEKCA